MIKMQPCEIEDPESIVTAIGRKSKIDVRMTSIMEAGRDVHALQLDRVNSCSNPVYQGTVIP